MKIGVYARFMRNNHSMDGSHQPAMMREKCIHQKDTFLAISIIAELKDAFMDAYVQMHPSRRI